MWKREQTIVSRAVKHFPETNFQSKITGNQELAFFWENQLNFNIPALFHGVRLGRTIFSKIQLNIHRSTQIPEILDFNPSTSWGTINCNYCCDLEVSLKTLHSMSRSPGAFRCTWHANYHCIYSKILQEWSALFLRPSDNLWVEFSILKWQPAPSVSMKAY